MATRIERMVARVKIVNVLTFLAFAPKMSSNHGRVRGNAAAADLDLVAPPARRMGRSERKRAHSALPAAVQDGDGRTEVRHRAHLPQQDQRARSGRHGSQAGKSGDLPSLPARLLESNRALQQSHQADERPGAGAGPP